MKLTISILTSMISLSCAAVAAEEKLKKGNYMVSVHTALSAYGMESDLRNSADAGFAAHLVKPVDFAGLQAAMETALAGTACHP